MGNGGGGDGPGGWGGGVVVAYKAAASKEEQHDILAEMEQCTSRLPLVDASRVQMPKIVILESARLLQQDGPLALLPGNGSSDPGAGAPGLGLSPLPAQSTFFFNPFEKGATQSGSGGGGGSGSGKN
ncbi:unnamed protein product, partial [Discosporangium mesarthrocarpum]